jgi:hypothetical protein
MVRSAHVGENGQFCAYVECDRGHVHCVGSEAFKELRGGKFVVETRCRMLGNAQCTKRDSNPVRLGGALPQP